MNENNRYINILEDNVLFLVKKKIPKGNGKFRDIFVGNEETKIFFKKVMNFLEKKYSDILSKNQCSHGFRKKRSAISNAMCHMKLERGYILSIDIKDFFSSIKKDMLRDIISKKILDVCFIDDVLPQGLSTSPVISNIVMCNIDHVIEKQLNSLGIKLDVNFCYSRYVDDLTISIYSDNVDDCFLKIQKKVHEMIKNILIFYGFYLNESKTKYGNLNDNFHVTGISLVNHGEPTRKTKRKLRAALYQKNYKSIIGLINWMESVGESPANKILAGVATTEPITPPLGGMA
ncbi:retron-type reverse transcriptase [Psychromonas sp. CNPT3]|uniref:reverse transcriptase family protein n=1 Tax=Psychromonas sp. CNPT3 TaxID=314282 RepID=UPI0002C13EA3|nr:reverse transcriptase family protein [Psychromonas sp. CNPT3]AGH80921.1 retron-type reverse transcriptase [Psychromonas sp. CNPT3]